MKDFEITPEMEEMFAAIWKRAKETQPAMKIVDPVRYMEVMEAKEALEQLLVKSFNEPVVNMKVNYMCASAFLSFEVPCFEVVDKELFNKAISKANNFEITPKLNGNMEMAFTFRKYLVTVD